MQIITLDAETYFDDEYTLKKYTTEHYCRSEKFECHGWGVRLPDGQKEWLRGNSWRAFIDDWTWSQTAVLAHHAQFDLFILNHHYGIRPALILDTLSMARQVLGTHVSASLGSLADHYGLAAKNVPYNLFRGKHWHQLSEAEQRMVAEGCLHDCDLTFDIFQRLAVSFPAEEYGIVDMTVRMFTEPVLEADVDLLGKVWSSENAKKRDLLAELGVSAGDLQSADKFADLLRKEGIEPPVKDGKNGKIYAFAKTDDFIKEAAEEDDTVGDLVRARLGVKSTLAQTRAEQIGFMAQRGPLPVYLRYCGAHTTRWSGGDSSNFQNLPRGSDLRRAIRAPKGYKLAVVDASQIEARILDTIAGEWDMVEKWRANIDIYSDLATGFYGYQVSKETPEQRQFGKVLKLQSGYGAGADSIQRAAKRAKPAVILDDVEALAARDHYRSRHPNVVNRWREAGRMLSRLGGGEPTQWGPMLVKDKRVFLPNGGWLDYSSLEYDDEWQSWRYKTRKGWKKIYGSALVAETTQALARVLLSQAVLRLRADHFQFVWTTHDDIVALVKADGSEYARHQQMLAEMSRSPAWLPDVPLAAEGALEEFYAK